MINTITIETDLVTLNEVLSKTGNFTLSVALLSGTYVEPKIDKVSKKSTTDGTAVEKLKYVDYNMWNNEVSYTNEKGYYRNMDLNKWNSLEAWVEIPVNNDESNGLVYPFTEKL